MVHSTRAIVLSKTEFGESDRYVEFFTEKWGIVTALAKAARQSKRRYVGGLDLFCHDEIWLRGEPKGTPYLQELTVINSFQKLREDLDRMLYAGQWLQWIRKLGSPGYSQPQIYRLLGQTLSLLEKEENRFELLGLVFRLKLLSILGLKPRMDRCGVCSEQISEFSCFIIGSGGLVCRNCLPKQNMEESFVLEHNDRSLIDLGDRVRFSQWDQFQFSVARAKSLNRLITQFACYHSHVRLPV